MAVVSSLQAGLPFEFDGINESTMRAAYARTGLAVPFEIAVTRRARSCRALAICLNRVAHCVLKQQRKTHGQRR